MCEEGMHTREGGYSELKKTLFSQSTVVLSFFLLFVSKQSAVVVMLQTKNEGKKNFSNCFNLHCVVVDVAVVDTSVQQFAIFKYFPTNLIHKNGSPGLSFYKKATLFCLN